MQHSTREDRLQFARQLFLITGPKARDFVRKECLLVGLSEEEITEASRQAELIISANEITVVA